MITTQMMALVVVQGNIQPAILTIQLLVQGHIQPAISTIQLLKVKLVNKPRHILVKCTLIYTSKIIFAINILI